MKLSAWIKTDIAVALFDLCLRFPVNKGNKS